MENKEKKEVRDSPVKSFELRISINQLFFSELHIIIIFKLNIN